MLKNHNTVTPMRLEPAAPRSRVKHSSTEPLRSNFLLHNSQRIVSFVVFQSKNKFSVALQSKNKVSFVVFQSKNKFSFVVIHSKNKFSVILQSKNKLFVAFPG